MLRNFALHDENLEDKQVGTFSYNTETKQFSMTLDATIPLSDLPLTLEGFAYRKLFSLSHEEVLRFIRGRICPPGRHNIREILADNDLPEYDEFGLLMITMARCGKDGLYLIENTEASKRI